MCCLICSLYILCWCLHFRIWNRTLDGLAAVWSKGPNMPRGVHSRQSIVSRFLTLVLVFRQVTPGEIQMSPDRGICLPLLPRLVELHSPMATRVDKSRVKRLRWLRGPPSTCWYGLRLRRWSNNVRCSSGMAMYQQFQYYKGPPPFPFVPLGVMLDLSSVVYDHLVQTPGKLRIEMHWSRSLWLRVLWCFRSWSSWSTREICRLWLLRLMTLRALTDHAE